MKQACDSGDRRGARKALQRWLREYGPDRSGSLLDFSATLESDELVASLRALDSDGFRPDASETWNGKATWKQFSEWHRGWIAQGRNIAVPLTDLYAKENRQA